MSKGIVYLIGAGCGKWDLITVRGLEILKKADAVVYDDLIDNELLEKAGNAELIYMGKRAGHHSAPQNEITKKLIELSKAGKTVARLKGGDPFVFGRGGEEMTSLKKEGIECVYIPGVSSSIAIPGFEGIPVTQRKISQGFMVVTGHTASENEDEEKNIIKPIIDFPGTAVILMGLGKIEKITSELIKGGKNPDKPAAVISGGNSDNPICIKGTIKTISEKTKKSGVKSPAVIVIGDTVNIENN